VSWLSYLGRRNRTVKTEENDFALPLA